MIDNLWSLDLETKSKVEGQPQYALEPYRLPQGKAEITDISIIGPNFKRLLKLASAEEVTEALANLKGKIVIAHNALFDIAWLYALTENIDVLKDIVWRDTMLLAKHLINSQSETFKTKAARDEEGGYDLFSLVKRFVDPKTPMFKKFLDMKSEDHVAGDDEEYWSNRAHLDTIFTKHLCEVLMDKLPPSQRNVFLISQKQMPYVARAWVEGCDFDWERVQKLQPQINDAKITIAAKLGLHPSVIQSPAQLSDLMFVDWGLTPIHVGKPCASQPGGRGSTAKDDLKMLALKAQGTEVEEKMDWIMKFKKIQTLQTKYMNGFERVYDYVGSAKTHGSPRLFGTYTGRYTYASKTQRKQVCQNSIAMHQLPREGPAKACILPPDGYIVGKYDASGQEIGFMANASRDVNMISVLCNGMNVHSWMATNINGEDYDSFLRRLKDDPEAYNQRQAAKLLNLSCQYRIGWAAIQAKFFGTYGIIIDKAQSVRYLGIYKSAYPGVVNYWKDTCVEAQQKGYAETIAGRRYYLTDWRGHRWGTESSAINFPVQGSGADQKDLIIWLVSQEFPEAKFSLDIHDEGVFFLPSKHASELNKDIVHFLNGIDYEHWWQKEVPMPLTFEGQIGKNFKECKEYAQPWGDIIKMRADLGRRPFI